MGLNLEFLSTSMGTCFLKFNSRENVFLMGGWVTDQYKSEWDDSTLNGLFETRVGWDSTQNGP